jgi:nitrous-oxide reductase
MLNTSHGFVPWDDLHHIAISTTNAEHDARWAFGNANNTPRIARVDLTTFKTVEIIELPNSGGNHSSPFITENTEYVVAGTRFSVPTGAIKTGMCLSIPTRKISAERFPSLV